MNKIIIDTLSKTKVPVSFRHYTGKEKTYITFFEMLNTDEMFADDEAIVTGRYYQIDVWSKENYTNLVKEVESLLKSIGFRKRSHYDAPYEKDTGLYHKVLRYFYKEE